MNSTKGSLVCLTVAETTVESMIHQIAGNSEYIDLAEIRADYLDAGEIRRLAELPGLTKTPLLCTIRRSRDGGNWYGTENKRRELLLGAAAGGFRYLDMESDVDFPEVEAICRRSRTTVVRSLHNFTGVPDNFTKVVESLPRNKDEIAKAAVLPRSTRDLIEMIKACKALGAQRKIILGMGPWGFPTRVLAGKLGSFLTFCSPSGMETAPGHIDPKTLVETYRFKSVTPATGVFCIAANPVMHSRSPWIHNPGLETLAINAVYIPIQIDEVALLFELAGLLDIQGASISVPHKSAVRKFLASEDKSVTASGSCNTIYRTGDGYLGVNTDFTGFTASLTDFVGGRKRAEKMSATVIGSGGTARTVLYALKRLGVTACVVNRTPQKAEALAGEFGCSWAPLHESALSQIKRHRDLIIQTTSAGMIPQEGVDPFAFYEYSGNEFVYDVIYTPPETAFLKRAKKAGCQTCNGERMLLEQAYAQFKLFAGVDYPAECRGRIVF